jgi:hypothetical protein
MSKALLQLTAHTYIKLMCYTNTQISIKTRYWKCSIYAKPVDVCFFALADDADLVES